MEYTVVGSHVETQDDLGVFEHGAYPSYPTQNTMLLGTMMIKHYILYRMIFCCLAKPQSLALA